VIFFFCDLFFETNNLNLCAVVVLCLVSVLQEPPSPGIELRTLFPEFWSSYVLFLVSRNKHAKFGANWYIRSRAISSKIPSTISEVRNLLHDIMTSVWNRFGALTAVNVSTVLFCSVPGCDAVHSCMYVPICVTTRLQTPGDWNQLQLENSAVSQKL
jgi:hypothetical protein